MKFLYLLLTGVSLLLPATAGAQETAPDVLVRSVTTEVLDIIRRDQEIQSGDTRRAMELVDEKVLPHFNFERMTALAVGRDWNKATPEQKKALTAEFRTLLVRTYSNSLTAYRNQTVDFKPMRAEPGATDVVVRTQINQPGGKPLMLDYSLEKTTSGWKVYDVTVGGVSLVTNYRDSFAQQVRSNGIEGLIKALQAKNRSLASVARSERQ